MLWRVGTVAGAIMMIAGCSGSGDAGGVATPPSKSGDVWEIDSAGSRATAPGAMLAFANGLHVIVIDGDDVYAGMRKLHLGPPSDSGRALDIGNSEVVRLVQAADGYELHFAGGETVRLHKQSRTGGNT